VFLNIRVALISLTVWGVSALPVVAQSNVRLTVAVSTADKTPIRDLSKGDFSVQDVGKSRAIENFAGPRQVPSAPPQLQPDQFTNAPDVTHSGAIFVVLDTIHTRYIDERDMRGMILKFMGRAAESKHAVTLAILTAKGLTIYHDYRSGSDVLQAALIKAGLGGMKGGTPPSGVDDALATAEAARLTAFSKGDLSNATPPEQLVRSIAEMPMVMFQDVGHAAYGLPGRKALVWVTNAVPFDIDPKTFNVTSPKETNRGVAVNGTAAGGSKDVFTADEMKKLLPLWRTSMRALFDGGVAVYPVEARNSFTAGSDTLIQGRMKLLAKLTGGKAFYGANDPFPELLQISSGNVGGYVLGFGGDANASPEFHHLQVSVNKPGVDVGTPEGYFPFEGTLKEHAPGDINLALQSQLPYTGIPFTVTLTGTADAAGKKKVNMTVALAGDTGVLNEANRTVDLLVMAVAKDSKGATVGKLNEGAGGQFPPEAVAQIKELGFQLKRSIEVPAGDLTLHFVIRDNQDGRMGSLIVPLKVQ
jgi:VWFA-related protein